MRFAISLFLLTTCLAFAGVAFGVNPIGPMPETYVGYKIGPVVPYLSLSLVNAGGRIAYYWEDYDENYDPPYSEGGDTIKFNGSVLAPTFGTKLVFGPSELKPFIRLSAGIPFLLTLNAEVSDEDEQEYIDEVIEDIREGMGTTLLLTGGMGVEYYFADRFSIGGEFNYHYLSSGGEWEYSDTATDGSWWWREVYDVSGRIGGTSAGMWLNYYF